MLEVIYREGETTIIATITNGRVDYTFPMSPGKNQNLTVEEFMKTLAPGCSVIEYEEAMRRCAEVSLGKCREWEEIDEETWFEALEILPPERWHQIQNVEIFRIGEHLSSFLTDHYAQINGRYFKTIRMLDADYAKLAEEVRQAARNTIGQPEQQNEIPENMRPTCP